MVVKNVPMGLYKEAHCIIANEPCLSDKTIQDAIAMFENRRASNLPVIPVGLLHPDIDTAINREAFDMLFLKPLKTDELFGNPAAGGSSDSLSMLAATIKLASIMKLPSAGNKSDFTGYVLNRLKERGCFVNAHMGTDFPCGCEISDETLNPKTPETGENHG